MTEQLSIAMKMQVLTYGNIRAFGFARLSAMFAILIGVWSAPVLAQTISKETSSLGAFVHGGLNLHSANFQTLPGVPSCCPRFESGSGMGFQLGAYYDLPLTSAFSMELRLGYSSRSATLTANEFTTVLIDGSASNGEFEHSVAANIGMIGITPLASYHILPQAALLAGPTLGWILSNNFSEREMIVQPVNRGVFADNGQRVRNAYSGVTPEAAKIYAGLTVGAQYRLPLNASGTLSALPEAFYTVGLTPLVSGMKWRANSISGGVALQYNLFLESVPPAVSRALPPHSLPEVVELPKSKPPLLTASLSFVGSDSETIGHPIKELVIEDYIRTQYRPILNYIFFDKGSSKLPARYHILAPVEMEAFSYLRLNEYEMLPLYYEVLNIIGKRMRDIPKGELTIVGCNDLQTEGGDKTLTQSRAETTFNYLKDTWKINPNRMKIDIRNLPVKPSGAVDTDVSEENRRVEIYSNLPQIVEPLLTTDTAHIPKPSVISFLPRGIAEAGVANWEVEARSNPEEGSKGKRKDFFGKDSLTSQLDWHLEKEGDQVLALLDTIHAVFRVTDRAGQTTKSEEAQLPVRHYTLPDKHHEGSADTIISRYSMILFDFDRGALSDANQRIADFVKARISNKSKVRILGYTDRIGTDKYNQQLSELRARSIQSYMGLDESEVRGLGHSVLLYDNSLPEGRLYSRTVTVEVTTPTRP